MLRCDVLVVGCGPVGAVLTARLRALGVDVLAVERAPAPYGLPRAVAADDEVQALLDTVASGLLDGAVHDVPVRFADARGRELGRLRFPPGPLRHSGLALFSQPLLEARLAPLVEPVLRRGVGLAGFAQDRTGVSATLTDGAQVRTDWMIGCDGAASAVRRAAGIGWRGRDLSRWLVVDVAGDAGRPQLTYTCDPARPTVDMPTPGGHRWEWLLRDGPAPDPRRLVPTGLEIVRAVTYRYGARRAEHWRSGRVVLAGDAAHTMPPFAGQGLGAGIRDAMALAPMLAGGDPSRYEALRAPHVAAMTRLSLLLGALVETRHLTGPQDLLLRSAFRAPMLGPWLQRGGPRRSASGLL